MYHRRDKRSNSLPTRPHKFKAKEYIATLERKNRILHNLNAKKRREQEIRERKEEGFSVFFRGANTTTPLKPITTTITTTATTTTNGASQGRNSRNRKRWNEPIVPKISSKYTNNNNNNNLRQRQQQQRKNWKVGRISIRTEDGDEVQVKPSSQATTPTWQHNSYASFDDSNQDTMTLRSKDVEHLRQSIENSLGEDEIEEVIEVVPDENDKTEAVQICASVLHALARENNEVMHVKPLPSSSSSSSSTLLRPSTVYAKATPSIEMNSLIHRVRKLEPTKQACLLELLSHLEKGESDELPPSLWKQINEDKSTQSQDDGQYLIPVSPSLPILQTSSSPTNLSTKRSYSLFDIASPTKRTLPPLNKTITHSTIIKHDDGDDDDDELMKSYDSLQRCTQKQRGRIDVVSSPTVTDDWDEHSFVDIDNDMVINSNDGDYVDETWTRPDFPHVNGVEIVLLSNYGDQHYIGMSGIEFYDSNGCLCKVKHVNHMSSLNISSNNDDDPRVITNLIDGDNKTCDVLHMWLSAYKFGHDHRIQFQFHAKILLSAIRIWNYNENRIHSIRGVKKVELTSLEDGSILYRGTVKQAQGVTLQSNAQSELIIFSNNQEKRHEITHMLDNTHKINDDKCDGNRRPLHMSMLEEQWESLANDWHKDQHEHQRPLTASTMLSDDDDDNNNHEWNNNDIIKESPISPYHRHHHQNNNGIDATNITIHIDSTWGDMNYVGLTGLQLLGANNREIMWPSEVKCVGDDVNSIGGDDSNDPRTLDKVLNGHNVTTNYQHMWLAPFLVSGQYIRFILPHAICIHGIKLWNYNKSPLDTQRGVKLFRVLLNDIVVGPHATTSTFCARQAVGHCQFDYQQSFTFHRFIPTSPVPTQRWSSYTSPNIDKIFHPCGFVLTLVIRSNYGDPFYVGLNGITLYDANDNEIKVIEPSSIVYAYPPSVCVLKGMENDKRTPDKIFDGVNDTIDDRHMWLTVLNYNNNNDDDDDKQAKTMDVQVCVCFDEAVTLSKMRIWNYRKTPARGVREVSLSMDGLLVYHGEIRCYDEAAYDYDDIMFTNGLIQSIKPGEQQVEFINERQVMTRAQSMCNLDFTSSPKTTQQQQRPYTATRLSKVS